MKLFPIGLALSFCVLGSQAFGATKTFDCKQGKSLRRVEHTMGDGGEYACKVTYSKVTEIPGDSKIIYSARADEKYCDDKVPGFLEKLKAGGWNCEEKAAK